jgi:trehalose 6-phosphate synthase/phosphatase
LVQVAVPSRTDVEEYQNLRATVNELVGRINGKYGSIDFTPIHFLNRSVSFEELVALYAVSDACLVSSTRDGMNLVSYEYITCQQENHGVLILSEFAGAAQSLNGSIIVNPWNTEELATAIYDALTMDDAQRATNHQKLFRYVTKYTAAFWGLSFVKELRRVSEQYDQSLALPKLTASHVITRYQQSQKKKVIFLDYDGTLTASHKVPELARPSTKVIETLKKLGELPNVLVYILSGRGRLHLDKWFEETQVGLSAEHGCFYKHPAKIGSQPILSGAKADTNGWWCQVTQTDSTWKSVIMPLFQHYTARTPGSFIEEKEINLTWHYGNADPEFGAWQATELQVNLEKLLSHIALSIVFGNKTLELRPSSIDKATAAKAILKDLGDEVDFLLCIGDGRTDEVVFSMLHELPYAITGTVGKKRTEAQFYLDNVSEVHALMLDLAK